MIKSAGMLWTDFSLKLGDDLSTAVLTTVVSPVQVKSDKYLK